MSTLLEFKTHGALARHGLEHQLIPMASSGEKWWSSPVFEAAW
jgi:hypothetical protein